MALSGTGYGYTDPFDTKALSSFLFRSTWWLTTPYEKSFDPRPFSTWASNNYPVVFGIVAAYLAFLVIGTKVMKNRMPFDLRMPLALWNAFLCVFSFIGMCRTVPFLMATVLSSPFEATVCTTPLTSWGTGPTGFWVMLFIFSKVPELIDTVFIVLRKKPLLFLHWYHHVSVLLFCWQAYSSTAGSGLYFVAMNYSVHALMYGYYCLQALNLLPKAFPTILITLSQIAQMFVGTGVCISGWYYKLSGHTCSNDMGNLMAGAVMYGSYLYLFSAFAFKRYGGKKGGDKGGKMVAKEI